MPAARHVLLVAAMLAAPAAAPAAEPAEVGTFSLTVENDLLYGRDRHYTNGIRLAWVSPPDIIPEWLWQAATTLPFFPDHGQIRASFALGQNMFTPEDITDPDPPRDGRPYAGWLYGAAGLVADTGTRLDRVELALGVVGPASLTEQAQKITHKLTGSPQPRGWDSQLENEPAVLLTWQRAWREPPFLGLAGFEFDASPRVGVALGNVFTHASGGIMLRFGQSLPHDYGPPLIQPTAAGSGFFLPREGFGWYLFASLEGRAVLRNIFLDGNTFRDSRSVDKEPFVGDAQIGIAATFGLVQVAYTHVMRTPEFAGQSGLDHFGAVSLSMRF